MPGDQDEGRGVAGNVAPLSSTERSRRRRERLRAERAKAGSGVSPDSSWSPAFPQQRPPFALGNQAAVTTGANSPARVSALAQEVAAELLGDRDTPEYVRKYPHAVMAWATAEAICRLLRAWLDTQALDDALSEVTTGEESEARTGMGAQRSMRTRRTMSVLDQLHRHETRAMHLRQRLGLDPVGRAKVKEGKPAFDLALYYAAQEHAENEAG